MSEYYHEDLTRGLVDYHETEERVEGDCLTRVKANVRENEVVEEKLLIKRCVQDFRYPPRVVREKIDQLDGRVIRRSHGQLRWKRY